MLRHRLGPRRAELATERIYLQLWRSADFDVTGSVATLLLELVRRHLTDPVEQPRAPRR
ncbi:hypothetical protein [Pseudonocardia sp. N23]|uniref:hypothetical protein n=1 Tax=Pseudonocardia sp. N23 TaxID=1987376 RepID=UPI000C0262C3|nr:hypothetical protein [Pseudonocardia sp. N23]GAY08365.1 hypothetical protein TOK_1922 [Pseudonocardia sp. N23]